MQYLDMNEIKYEFQKIVYIYEKNGIIERFFILDFCFPNKLVIEIDGKQHRTKEGKKNDKERSDYLRLQSYKVRRVSNKIILRKDMFERWLTKFYKKLSRKTMKPRARNKETGKLEILEIPA